jgi:hypothetical protein|tara:strand:- start:2913 stop:3179 length:267 start_codon:yes stop_codon:yes gene_type:complete
MKKVKHQQRGLIKTKRKLDKEHLQDRTAPDGEFRIIGVNKLNNMVWVEDTVNTFAKAKKIVDNFYEEMDVVYYVHNDSNRIIYDSKKE